MRFSPRSAGWLVSPHHQHGSSSIDLQETKKKTQNKSRLLKATSETSAHSSNTFDLLTQFLLFFKNCSKNITRSWQFLRTNLRRNVSCVRQKPYKLNVLLLLMIQVLIHVKAQEAWRRDCVSDACALVTNKFPVWVKGLFVCGGCLLSLMVSLVKKWLFLRMGSS